ncbi:MFS transporter [Desulfosporosinus burensis]
MVVKLEKGTSYFGMFLKVSLRLRGALLILYLGYVLTMFHRVAIAIMADRLIHDLHLNLAEMSVMTAVYFYPYALMQLPVGILVDRIGPKRLVSAMMLLTAVASIAFALATTFQLTIIARLLIGLSVSCVFVPAEKFIANYFPKEMFSTLTSLLVFSGIIGTVCASVPLAYLVELLDWRTVYFLMGVMALFLSIAAWFLLDDEQMLEKSEQKSDEIGFKRGLKWVLSEWGMWPIAIRNFLGYGVTMAFQSLLAGPYLIVILGMNRVSAGYMIMLLSVGQLLSLPFSGMLSDKVFHSRKVPLLIASFGSIIFWLPFAFFSSVLLPWHIAVLFIFSGLLAGFSSGPVFTLLKELYPTPLTGTAIGIGNFFTMAGAAIIPLFCSVIIAQSAQSTGVMSVESFTNGYRYLLLISGAAGFATIFSKDTSLEKNMCKSEVRR